MAQCRSCESLILWAKTESGKMMPLDEQPVNAQGPFGRPGTEPVNLNGLFSFVGGKAKAATEEDRRLHRPLHRCHFATCPSAERHRK